jgi:hypothetical protein
MFVSGTKTCRPCDIAGADEIGVGAGGQSCLALFWFRDRMIFLRSIVKLVAFAEAPSVLTHEG